MAERQHDERAAEPDRAAPDIPCRGRPLSCITMLGATSQAGMAVSLVTEYGNTLVAQGATDHEGKYCMPAPRAGSPYRLLVSREGREQLDVWHVHVTARADRPSLDYCEVPPPDLQPPLCWYHNIARLELTPLAHVVEKKGVGVVAGDANAFLYVHDQSVQVIKPWTTKREAVTANLSRGFFDGRRTEFVAARFVSQAEETLLDLSFAAQTVQGATFFYAHESTGSLRMVRATSGSSIEVPGARWFGPVPDGKAALLLDADFNLRAVDLTTFNQHLLGHPIISGPDQHPGLAYASRTYVHFGSDGWIYFWGGPPHSAPELYLGHRHIAPITCRRRPQRADRREHAGRRPPALS